MNAEQELAAMLLEIIRKAAGRHQDSCGADMKSVRVALLDKASELLAKHGH